MDIRKDTTRMIGKWATYVPCVVVMMRLGIKQSLIVTWLNSQGGATMMLIGAINVMRKEMHRPLFLSKDPTLRL